MLIFLDTEFTKFSYPDLISLALVAEDGREFYAERTDYRQNECSAFVQETVLPLLGRVPGAACTSKELTDRVRHGLRHYRSLPPSFSITAPTGICWPLRCPDDPRKIHQQILRRRFF